MARFVLKGEPREERGSRSMTKLRKAGRLPANIYGHKQPNRLVTLDTKELGKFIAAGHRILTVAVDGTEESGVLKEVQYDSLGSTLIHADITRVDIHEKITMAVRIEPVGIAKGVSAGGTLDLAKPDVQVEGEASDLPEKIEVRIETLDLGQSIRIKDLPPIPGCQLKDDPEQVVISVLQKRVDEVPGEAPAAAVDLPEVIGETEEEAKSKEEDGKKDSKGKGKDKDKG